jgi:hypothetical protein
MVSVAKPGGGTTRTAKTIWVHGRVRNVDYGWEGYCLCYADLTDPQHTAVVSDPEIWGLPLDLDTEIGTNLTAVQNALEAGKLPVGWVTATMTYRNLLKYINAACQLMRRLTGKLNTTAGVIVGAVTLETEWLDLPLAARTALQEIGVEWGLDTSMITGTSTVREIIKAVADQVPSMHLWGIPLGG